MKFSLKTFLAAALLPVASATSNLMTCASPDTTETDFFHHKVSPMYSENWDISYHGTYKVLTNKLAGESYLLYQCGTEPPAGAEDTYDQVISIPPQAQDSGVNIVSTPMIAYLELLGLRTSISGYIGSPTLVSSPCLIELINSGSVPVASSVGNATILEASGVPTDAITFVSGWTGDTVPEKTIVMQEYEESSFMGTMEWIKAYAAVFNVEDKANEVFDEAICRFEAIENNVASVTSDMQERPKVLWAYYSDYCGGWDVAEVNCTIFLTLDYWYIFYASCFTHFYIYFFLSF